jgi:hypothetical protein
MAGSTTNFLWPFPVVGDPANVAPDMASLAAAADASLGNAFTSYTPTWTCVTTPPSLGNGTLAGRFKRFGKWGIYNITLIAGNTTTFGTGSFRFALPAGWQVFALNTFNGTGSIFQATGSFTTSAVAAAAVAGPPSLLEIKSSGAGNSASGLIPFTWGTLCAIQMSGVIELV